MSDSKSKIGVLLVNLGSPEKTDTTSIRRFLREFLSDPRVVEIPRIIWLIILNLFVLPFRPKKLIEPYESIWTEEGSPLISIAYKQQKKLEQWFAQNYQHSNQDRNQEIIIKTAMTYGEPNLGKQLDEFYQADIDQLIVLPLYPQYSGSTTAAVFDVIAKKIQKWRNIPELSLIKSYQAHPLYIKALANTVKEKREKSQLSKNDQFLLMSFHGIPIDYCTKGDPYDKHCETTAKLLAKELNLSDNQWSMSYQSLFGKAEWLKPYTSVFLTDFAKKGMNQIDIICPGFSNDCLETLEEISVENKEIYQKAGGENYDYIPALNDRDDHIELLASLVNERIR